MKILVLNVYFAPNSFGGATIVAEEVIDQLKRKYGDEILVVTTIRDDSILPYRIRRYRAKDVNVIGINMREESKYDADVDNKPVTGIIKKIVNLYEPDLVHVHSIQTLGISYFDHIIRKKIPIVVTLHDCWWICDRQFMIDSSGQYCHQSKIDYIRCGYCTNEFEWVLKRDSALRSHLEQVDLLLSPSEFHRQLYIVNGFNKDRCFVNKNGVRLPKPDYKKQTDRSRTIFGFVGGPGAIKGGDLLVKAFRELGSKEYELKIVDAVMNMGGSWHNSQYWDIPGKVSFVPAYSQDTIDAFFSKIDVLLFPTQWKESFGLTVREALVRDVWVIATDAGGVSEDLVDGVNSTVIPFDSDHLVLKNAIEACVERKDWHSYKNPHREKVRGYEEQAAELHGYFESLLNKSEG